MKEANPRVESWGCVSQIYCVPHPYSQPPNFETPHFGKLVVKFRDGHSKICSFSDGCETPEEFIKYFLIYLNSIMKEGKGDLLNASSKMIVGRE